MGSVQVDVVVRVQGIQLPDVIGVGVGEQDDLDDDPVVSGKLDERIQAIEILVVPLRQVEAG